MKTLYLDIFSGLSGDLFLGALLDLGVDFHQLERELAKLGLPDYHLHAERRQKGGIEGVKFDVHLETNHHHDDPGRAEAHSHHQKSSGPPLPFRGGEGWGEGAVQNLEGDNARQKVVDAPHEHAHARARTFAEIRQLIADSALSDWVKQKSIAVFERVAVAEGKIHGQPPEQVHFHEVGAIDSIVDIVGACIALEILGRPRLQAAPVVDGTGWLQCAHGRLPIPAPATLEILSRRGVAISQCNEPHEMVTPTGAALLAELVESFGPMQDLVPGKVGYGLGTRDHQTRPNVLRAILGETLQTDATTSLDWETDTITTLQTNLDDINAEILGRFVELALAQGALDVFYTPIQMKKNRPGVLLTVLCGVGDADKFSELILRETSAFGVRRFLTERRKLQREVVAVKTPFGEVAVKLGRLNGEIVQAAPEFGSCKQLADLANVPLKLVYEAAIKALQR